MEFVTPYDVMQDSLSGKQIDIARGTGKWIGQAIFAECDESLRENANAISVFISTLEFRRRSFTIPIYRSVTPKDIMLRAETIIDGISYYRINVNDRDDIRIGMHVRIMDVFSRLYRIVQKTPTQVSLVPNIPGLTGRVMTPGTNVIAKLASGRINQASPHNINFQGPWTIEWEEWLAS